jgi:hypothetical protein
MRIINSFKVCIKTGSTGTDSPVRFNINGHVLEFKDTTGGTGPGEAFEGHFEPKSFAHHLSIEGPEEGEWEIEEISVAFTMGMGESYEVRMGPLMLGKDTCMDINRDAPLLSFDV